MLSTSCVCQPVEGGNYTRPEIVYISSIGFSVTFFLCLSGEGNRVHFEIEDRVPVSCLRLTVVIGRIFQDCRKISTSQQWYYILGVLELLFNSSRNLFLSFLFDVNGFLFRKPRCVIFRNAISKSTVLTIIMWDRLWKRFIHVFLSFST
jgi:hypothetical protein